MSSDQTVLAIAEQLFKTKPVEISSDPHAKEHDKLNWQGLRHCYSIVLLQEQQRYNKPSGLLMVLWNCSSRQFRGWF